MVPNILLQGIDSVTLNFHVCFHPQLSHSNHICMRDRHHKRIFIIQFPWASLTLYALIQGTWECGLLSAAAYSKSIYIVATYFEIYLSCKVAESRTMLYSASNRIVCNGAYQTLFRPLVHLCGCLSLKFIQLTYVSRSGIRILCCFAQFPEFLLLLARNEIDDLHP